MRTIKAIIFDMNGTLINDEHVHHEATRQVAAEYGLDLSPELFEKLCIGLTVRQAQENIRKHFNATYDLQEFADKRREKFFELWDNTLLPMEPTIALLESLQSTYELALVSNSTRQLVDRVLARYNLGKYFKVIVTIDDVKNGKPDPEPYEVAAKQLGVKPEECIVIEDTYNGIKSAKVAGMYCVAVETTSPKDRLQEADKIGKGLDDVPALIKEIISS